MTAPLRALVAQSALPLRSVEEHFAVDSSGFSVWRAGRQLDRMNAKRDAGSSYPASPQGSSRSVVPDCIALNTLNLTTATKAEMVAEFFLD
jgi:hypothetical protein